MSVTTTQNSRITGLRRILADHELHHSDPTADEAEPAPRPNAQLQSIESNPPDWEGRWRRVPAYRPVQDQRGEQHDTYTGAVERNFVRVMFGGVSAMAVRMIDPSQIPPVANPLGRAQVRYGEVLVVD